jgi:hypothetical protein
MTNLRVIRLSLLPLMVLAACGREATTDTVSTPTTPRPTVLTLRDLSDGEIVWCLDHLEQALEAAEKLGLPPLAVVDEKDFRNPDGSRDLDAMLKAWRRENVPGRFPVYQEPNELGLVINSPWRWYRDPDGARACRAAYEARS